MQLLPFITIQLIVFIWVSAFLQFIFMYYNAKVNKQQDFHKYAYNSTASVNENQDFSNFPQYNANSVSKNFSSNYPTKRQQRSDSQHYLKQLTSLRQMNRLLKQENMLLRQIIRDQENEQNQQTKINIIQKLQDQINNFKHIIEKSYYTIKELESQNADLEHLLKEQRKNKENLFDQLEQLRQNNYTLSNKLRQQENEHYRQVSIIKNRINDLQDNIADLLRTYEIEQRQFPQRYNSYDNKKNYYQPLH